MGPTMPGGASGVRIHDLIRGGSVRLAKKALFTSTMWFGVAALAVASAALPADARSKRKTAAKQMIPDQNSSAISHAAESEDTRVHAIDPFVVAAAEAVTDHAFATSTETPLEITASEEARSAMVEAAVAETAPMAEENVPVSYTHLTLPTIY